MKYTLDCEFNGYRGELLSLALYSPQRSIYLVNQENYFRLHNTQKFDPWVQANVCDKLLVTDYLTGRTEVSFGSIIRVQSELSRFLCADTDIEIHADWPDDLKYFNELLITGPGTCIETPALSFQLHWINAYSDAPEALMRHHAWHDAAKLYHRLF